MTRETYTKQYTVVSWPEFVEWGTSCITILEQLVPLKSVHRNTVEKFGSLGNEPEKLQFGISFLKSIKADLESGFLDDLVLQIESEVTADYLGQAESLLSEGGSEQISYVAAAVLAGVVLEKSLRTICANLDPPELVVNDKGTRLGMNALIEALKKRQIFNELHAKQLRAWADVRNSAAHGRTEEFDKDQVKLMIAGVNAFVSSHLR
ncbi:MAG: DUF4145 domain-containing protein [Acidobacteria bacterium]|nr:DUF4145 domain-containing protein [Acidobacteriota bacterium]